MLKNALPDLKKNIKDILEKSLYEAQMTSFIGSDSSVISNYTKSQIEEAAKKYAQKAAETAAEPLSNAIYEFVLQIGILTYPKALIDSMGKPVTGVITNNEFQIT